MLKVPATCILDHDSIFPLLHEAYSRCIAYLVPRFTFFHYNFHYDSGKTKCERPSTIYCIYSFLGIDQLKVCLPTANFDRPRKKNARKIGREGGGMSRYFTRTLTPNILEIAHGLGSEVRKGVFPFDLLAIFLFWRVKIPAPAGHGGTVEEGSVSLKPQGIRLSQYSNAEIYCAVIVCAFLFMFSILSSFAGYFLPVLFCMLSMLISDSRFDLVWFRLSCDHGWIRSGSVNVRKQQQQQ